MSSSSQSSSQPGKPGPVNRSRSGTVLARFPDHWPLIVQRCREDEDFRELCGHYAECQTVLKRTTEQAMPAPGQIREYEELISDLEQEILRLIGVPERHSPRP